MPDRPSVPTPNYTPMAAFRAEFYWAQRALSPYFQPLPEETVAEGATTDEQDGTAEKTKTDEKAVSIEDATVTASAEIGPASMHSPPDCFDDLEISVWEDYYGIQINIEAEDNESDRLSRFGMLLELDEDSVGELIEALEAFR